MSTDLIIDNDGWTVITFTTFGYIHFIDNLLASMKLANISWTLTVICVDQASYEYYQTREVNCLHMDLLPNTLTQGSFEDAQFKQTVFKKLDVIRFCLNLVDRVKNLVYIDGDIVIYKDFVPSLKELFNANESADVFFQCDEPYSLKCNMEQGHSCPYMCTGFLAMRNNQTMRNLFDYETKLTKSIQSYSSDQEYFNEMRSSFSPSSLPRHLFPNGTWITVNDKNISFLLHYNWLIGDGKRQTMIAHNDWFI